MTAYILCLVLMGVESWYLSGKGILLSKKNKRLFLIVCCAEMIALAALRGHTVGADTRTYLDALEYYAALPKNEILFAKLVKPFDFEPGYFLLTKLCALVNMHNSLFLMIVAALIYIPVFISIYHYSKMPYVSILAYFGMGFFSYSLGIFRQMIAISIVLCGIRYISERQLQKYLLVIAVAMLFHTTAIAAVALYFVANFPLNKYVKWILPVEVLGLVLGRPLVMLAVTLFPKYAGYVGGRYDVQGGSYLMLFLLNGLLFLLIYMNYRGFTKSKLKISALTIAVMIQTVAYSMGLLGRVVIYFSYFAIFAFSDIAYVMLTKPAFFNTLQTDVVSIWYTFDTKLKRHKITGQTAVMILLLAALGFLVLYDLWGNYHVSPYYFFFWV